MLVYIEVVIIDNLIIDYIILHVCGMVERRKLKIFRGLLASMMGVAIAILATRDIPNAIVLALKILSSLGMVLIAFGREKFLKMLFDFYFFTFAIGGVALGFLYLKSDVASGLSGGIFTMPTGVIFGAVFLGYIFAKRCIYILNRKGVENEFSYVVKLQNECMSLLTSGFLDSGNQLVFNGDLRGVCVGEYVNFASFFKGEKPRGQVAIETASGGDFLYVYNVKLVSVYKVDKQDSKKEPNESQLIFSENDVPFALTRGKFCGDFRVLLSPMMF